MKTVKKYFNPLTFLCLTLCLSLLPIGDVSAKSKTEKRAEQIMSKMSWNQKIAQMLFVDAPANKAASIQKKYQFGGYVLFADDFQKRTPKQAKSYISSIQKNSKIKMLIAVDEEGGSVTRISRYSKYRKKPFASPRNVYKSGKWTGIRKDTQEKAKLLKSLGVNTNMAPVADVAYKSSNFIYKRSFSTSAKSTSTYVKTVVGEMGKKKLVSTVKHFPGYGNNGDTHTNMIRDKRSKKTFETRDLLPFKAGISAGCDMIMVSHNIVNCFDKKNPATLSPAVHTYLRNKLKFKGVIVTDSMAMKGVTKYAGSTGKAAIKAVQAGNDMIICSSQYDAQYKALCTALKKGQISKSKVNASVKRILMLKLKRGIIK